MSDQQQFKRGLILFALVEAVALLILCLLLYNNKIKHARRQSNRQSEGNYYVTTR